MNPEQNTTANTNPDNRDAGGRFAKGNRGGPGNPFARQTARLRQVMVDAVTPEDMRAIVEGLKKKAVDGDVPASKLIFSYCMGKQDPDTLDQHELKTIIGNHLDSAEGPLNVLKGMPLDVLVEMFSLILPILRTEKVKLAKKVLCAPLTEEEIEDNKVDEEDDEVPQESTSSEPAGDPFANIPDWMRDLGKEPEQPAPKPARKRKQAAQPKPPSPADAAVDAELLRVLLERARNLTATQPPQGSAPDPLTEHLKMTKGRQSPLGNGSNGKK